MKVLFCNPPSPETHRISRGLMGGFGMAVGNALVYPPLNVAYCAATLLAAGHPAEVVDANAEGLNEEETVRRIAGGKPGLIAVNTSSASIELDMRVGCAAGRAASAPVVLLGSHVTHTPEEVLNQSRVDYAIRGEAEYILLELVGALEQGGDARAIKGLSFWDQGHVQHNPDADLITDLDALPFPARHLLPQELYGMPDMGKPFTTVVSSRGCPLNCSYCGYTLSQGLRWRGRSAENVVAEIEEVYTRYGVRNLVFRDPLFSFDMARVGTLCRLLEERRIKVQWQCETAIRYLDEELLGRMARAGCVSVSLGVESANPEIQKKYSRGKLKSREHAHLVARACRKEGIRTRIFFMLGFPEDTRATIRETAAFARELDPDSVQFTTVMPFPGTRLEEDLKGKAEIRFEDLWGYKSVGICENLSNEELEREVKRAYRLFYMRPGRLLRELASPKTLLRRAQRYLGLYR